MNSTPASPFSSGDLASALGLIGRNPEARTKVLQLLQELEALYPLPLPYNVRELVTGPIVDSLFTRDEIVEKKISSGLHFSFRYSSKIARDFVMASPEVPGHVWEPQTTKLLLKLTRPGANVVVGGAYFGDQAIIVADHIKPDGVCHCFDLSKENTDLLRLNASRNGLNNVRALEMGLWSEATKLILVGHDSHASARPTIGDEVGLPATSIDEYCRSESIDRLDLICLDLEGGELAALRGGRSLLRQPARQAPAIVFEVHRSYTDWSSGLNATEIGQLLIGFGYTLFAIRDYQSNVDMAGRPVELIPSETAYLDGPPHGFNMIALKDPSWIDHAGIRIVRDVSPKLLFHGDPKLHQPLTST